jgi:ribosomal protein L12E/L44/L45/RPP1/RPP2
VSGQRGYTATDAADTNDAADTDERADQREERDDQREERDDQREERDDDHLSDVPDGAGCTEIWEHLAERREDETDG